MAVDLGNRAVLENAAGLYSHVLPTMGLEAPVKLDTLLTTTRAK